MGILSLLILAVAGIGRTRRWRANGHTTCLSINLKGLRGRVRTCFGKANDRAEYCACRIRSGRAGSVAPGNLLVTPHQPQLWERPSLL